MNMMISKFLGNEYESYLGEREIEVDLSSSELHDGRNMHEDVFRSMLNSNCREKSERTAETARLLNVQLTSQISKNLDESEIDLNSKILQAIDAAITEKAPSEKATPSAPEKSWGARERLEYKLNLRSMDSTGISKSIRPKITLKSAYI